jgi:hypothetical protein
MAAHTADPEAPWPAPTSSEYPYSRCPVRLVSSCIGFASRPDIHGGLGVSVKMVSEDKIISEPFNNAMSR